jgi:cytochrome bd-type quinol oxidase subunit 2
MPSSKTIAGLIGPTLIAIAVALLVNLESFPALAESVSRDPLLIFVSGVLMFIAGLAIVRVHNRWEADWTVLLTVLGWIALIGGLARMMFPIELAAMATKFSQDTGLIAAEAVVLLVVGAFLSYKGYGRKQAVNL